MKKQPVIDVYQGDLFSGLESASGLASKNTNGDNESSFDKEVLTMPDAKVTFYKSFFGWRESNELFQTLLDKVH